MQIQMVDLSGQYEKISDKIDSAIISAIRSTNYINGPEVKDFEKSLSAYLGSKYVIPCANGTDALQIALMALDLKYGDEIIVPAFTYVATAEVAALLGLKIKWVDVDPNTFNIDPQALESVISEKTKVIVPVHLYGQCADMERIVELAEKYNIHIVEDVAQALGAEYSFSDGKKHKAGTLGDIGCTSFFPSKNLGCYGDGGALFTNSDILGEKIRMIANHGQSVKYKHDLVGVNSRLDTLQAAILNVKLPHLDEYNSLRANAAAQYDELLKNIDEIQLPKRSSYSTHIFHQYTIIIKDCKRNALKEHLIAKGIPSMIYYPIPMHLQQAYLSEQYPTGSFPVAEKLSASVLSLPMHTELGKLDLQYICNEIKQFFKS